MGNIPSGTYDVPWLYAVHDQKFESGDDTGKWLIFLSPQFVDEWWLKVSEATLAGELGPVSKCSTMMPTKHDRRRKVICVYVWDIDDMDDVMRVRGKLRELGVTWSTPFKGCWQTAAGAKGSLFSA